ncbi:cell surface protein SprA [Reichenbachiella carrageenanivorans]|uniref:Cell surface protein SprA n=1 Tax=Reichenbachiella carrageenanivorans TaxID=2979869 RepID=A0ABY6D2U8_9BACT|nr:cell surface protein SprA [Reichenbachiella carrageenanivorans]UXX80477.1 cell surface protein SprA [Reichenbachiella carrageenanivorans]
MLDVFASIHFQQVPADTVKADTVSNPKYEPSYRPTFNQQDRFGDPFSNTQSPSPLLLEDPASMQLDLEIDTGMNYTIYERVGALNYRPRSTMTFEEFNQYQDAEMKKEYWQNRSAGLDGESAVSGRRLIPKLYISPIFDRIFGGSYVDIEPNGFVNLDFGGRWQRIENPAIPINQQRNGGFNYNQQISMNVVGKVGEKLAITANFDNNNSFDFQNNMKVEYTGYEEDIIKKIELGNVSMDVSNSLMTGGQSLFGIKTQLQFGKLYVTALASRQQGKSQSKTFQFGAEGQPFSLRAADYDERRHFFLGHFFRDNYQTWLRDIPQITSGVNITRVEVYVVNTTNETANVRNFVAFTDLGEGDVSNLQNSAKWGATAQAGPADNDANGLWSTISSDPSIRNVSQVEQSLTSDGLKIGEEYEIRPTARRLDAREYKWHSQLGYISLQRKLQNDEVLAVAYEYTYNGQKYRVGELSDTYSGFEDDALIYLKMLRPGKINTDIKTWDLMMKNVYSLNSPRINEEGFELRINYRDDTKNYDSPNLNEGVNTNNVPLIELLALDQLNVNGDNQKDGKFDFIPDVTFDIENGYVIFPVLEPFGSTLDSKFESSEQRLKDQYVFQDLYDLSKIDAQQNIAKNKFFINGTYSSSAAGVYPLNAFNIAQGSVKVTAGSQLLAEGVDYQVNYSAGGTVTILNQGVIASGKQINISYEVDDLFSFRSRWLTGARLDYRFSDKINVGATVFHLSERPGGVSRYTAGNEPIKNTKYGFDVNYQEESRMLTKIVDALPLISTKETSTVSFNGEFAQLLPGTSNKVDGESSSYIDDFESAVTPYNIGGGHLPWKLGATPSKFLGSSDLENNFRRAKMAWYIIDRSAFYLSGGNKPDNLTDEDMENHYVRPVLPQEIFKQQNRQVVNTNLSIFDIAYYPEERGPYNYSSNLTPDGLLPEPEKNFGAITRAISGEVNFRQNNMEYIEFWMMDPFIQGERGKVIDGIKNTNNSTGGKLIFNLGDVSENLLENGKHEFENGLPSDGGIENTEPTAYGKATTLQYLTEFFDNSASARPNQDIGLDGINSDEEAQLYGPVIGLDGLNATGQSRIRDDVAADDFKYFLDEEYDQNNAKVLERYKKFNGLEGNSPIGAGSNSFTASATNIPENEDINEDNYINTLDAYREYEIDLNVNDLEIGKHNIVDKVVSDDGEAAWYLFRIPINQPDRTVGDYSEESNRFIRMYMTEWTQPVVLRMAKMQLVASQWRKSTENLKDKGFDILPETGSSDFEVSVVNIEENSLPTDGKPPYVLPPGISRDQDNTTTISRQVNEQSLKICVDDLEDGDARAVYKEVAQDLVNYGRLKMFFHAEQYQNDIVDDGDMSAFIRIGLDQTSNYYEIEVPLVITPDNMSPYSREDVWPTENEIDIALNELYGVKAARNGSDVNVEDEYKKQSSDGKYGITIVGNPKLNNITTMMIGVRNIQSPTSAQPHSICIWANEMRVTDYDDTKGWAANARMSVKLADFATINAATRYTSVGFGGIQDNISQRTREESIDYDLSMNMNVDKLIPWKTGIKIPMFVSYSKSKQTPKYDPLDPDIPLDASVLKFDQQNEREEYKEKVISQTVNKSVNFIDVRKEKVKEDAKSHVYDIENFSFSYAYSEQKSSDVNTEQDFRKEYDGNVSYNYSPQPPSIEPFKNSESLSSPYLKLIKDINFSPLPSNFSARASMNRVFRKRQLRNADLTTTGIDPNYEKYFTFNRTYNLRWNVFKSLSVNYNATANAIIDEPEGDIDTQAKRDSVWNNVLSMGRMKSYDQSVGANYRLPLDKFPLTDWVSADYRYNVNYRWTGGNIGQVEEFGNLVENNRTRDLTGKFDLVKLYNKSKYLKSINSPARSRSSSTRSRTPTRVDTTQSSGGGKGINGFMRLLMSVRSVNFTYGQREATKLPGFTAVPYLFGMDSDFEAPGAAFIFGSQDPNIRIDAGNNGWLVKNGRLTTPFVQSLTDDLNLRANVEPFKDLKIQLDAKRSEVSGYQEIYRFDTVTQVYTSLTPSRSGSYTITFMPIKTAFVKDHGENISSTFEEFVENRNIIQSRLNLLNTNGEYDINSQDVLIPAFIAAYTGQNAGEVKLTPFPKTPVPNWRVDYAGLSKIPALRDKFASINLTHAYMSTFSITNYTNSLLYSDPSVLELGNSILDYPEASAPGDNGKLTPVYVINQVDVVERFSPLIGINIRTKNKITTKIEYKKERSLSLNLSNSQITELQSNDIAFDFGITKSQMKIPFKVNGRTVTLDNDIQFRLTFTVRDTKTIQRKIEDVQTVTNGNINYQIRPTLNYVANQKLNITMYFEKNINEPKISNTFNRTSSAFGIQMRFSLAQ